MTHKATRKTSRKAILNGQLVDVPYLDPAAVVPLFGRNALIGGEPGAGKSSLLNQLVARAVALGRPITIIDGKPLDPDLTPDPDFDDDDEDQP